MGQIAAATSITSAKHTACAGGAFLLKRMIMLAYED